MHLWQRRRTLGANVLSRRRLYLDLRFWNDLCDVEIGDARAPRDSTELLRRLRHEIAAQRLVCPVEYQLFLELHKQARPDKRRALVSLVDELSDRVVIVNQFDRVFLEALRLVQGLLGGAEPSHPPRAEVWTRPLYIFGHDLPPLPPSGMPPEVEDVLHGLFEERTWELGFADILEVSGDPPGDDAASKEQTAAMLTRLKQDPSNRHLSRHTTYVAEFEGALDGYGEQLAEVWRYLHEHAGLDWAGLQAPQRDAALHELKMRFTAAAAAGRLRHSLPTVHIGAAIYTHVQWDRRRPYRPNDLYDFWHAEAALAYCDAFATDRGLASLLRDSGLAETYPCEVMDSTAAILAWLDKG